MKKRLMKTGGLTAIVSVVILSVAACLPGPPKVSPTPPVARPVCQEEATDKTPNVLEFAWTYPTQLTVPQVKCQPKLNQYGHPMQIDVWISIGKNTAGVLSMLCSSLRGHGQGPTSLYAVWFVCMDVDRSKLGIPG